MQLVAYHKEADVASVCCAHQSSYKSASAHSCSQTKSAVPCWRHWQAASTVWSSDRHAAVWQDGVACQASTSGLSSMQHDLHAKHDTGQRRSARQSASLHTKSWYAVREQTSTCFVARYLFGSTAWYEVQQGCKHRQHAQCTICRNHTSSKASC